MNVDVQMKMFIVWAVEQTIMPMTMKVAPMRATYRRPIKSEREPTNGQTAASARRLARTWTCQSCVGEERSSLTAYKPDPSIHPANVTIDNRRYPAFQASVSTRPTKKAVVPKMYTGIWEPVHRKAIATKDMTLLIVH